MPLFLGCLGGGGFGRAPALARSSREAEAEAEAVAVDEHDHGLPGPERAENAWLGPIVVRSADAPLPQPQASPPVNNGQTVTAAVPPAAADLLHSTSEVAMPAMVPITELAKAVGQLRFLGKGGQGVVFEGTWRHARVAVKYCVFSNPATTLDTIMRELLISKSLSHPHVVHTYDTAMAILDAETLNIVLKPPEPVRPVSEFMSNEGFGNPKGKVADFDDIRGALVELGAQPGDCVTQLVMEVAPGGSLADAIKAGTFKLDGKCWPPRAATRALLRTMGEVARGMAYLHASNIIHGDLKPGNVLLVCDQQDRRGFSAKLSDFGLARLLMGRDHVSAVPLATVLYTAPETHSAHQLFPGSDVWAFGLMIWEICHGRPPYEMAHQIPTLVLQYSAKAKIAPQLGWKAGSGGVYKSLERVCRRCVAGMPQERPTFATLLEELAELEARVRASMDTCAPAKPATAAAAAKASPAPPAAARAAAAPAAAAAVLPSAARAPSTLAQGPMTLVWV